MTDQVSGSSLPQARDLGQQQQQRQGQEQGQGQEPEPEQQSKQDQDQERQHQHQHQHSHLHYRTGDSSHDHNHNHNHHHNHQHNHQHLHHARSQRSSKPPRRDTSQEDAYNTSDVVVIVETISVIQVTDSTGSTIIRTLPHDHPTTPGITDSQSEPTVATTTERPTPTDLPDATSISSTSDDGNDITDPSSLSSSTVEDPTVTPSGSSMPTSFPTFSYASITSTPLSPGPIFPSIGGLSNSTLSSSSSSFSNSSASSHSFSSASGGNFSAAGSTGTRSTSSSSHASSSVFTHSAFGTSVSETSTLAYFTSTVTPDATWASGGDGGGDGSNGAGSPTDADSSTGPVASSAPSSDSEDTSAATIAGSVVGAISGLAIILFLAAVIFRWKKRQTSMKLIQGPGNDRGAGTMTTGGRGGPSGDGDMSERRRSIPFAIPAALANLSGQGRFSKSTVSSDGGERGFAKISGRKLPPVLQFGGDGYTDPRETMMSDQSIEYRASQNFFGEAALSRLAVGSPMLRETGIPVFHSSPARTAVPTPGPFSDPFSDDNVIESPTLPPDPVGRSHLSLDRSTRSHVSFSRFTEDL